MKLSHIMGTVTIIAIVGGTIYAIKKHKDLEKSKGEEISLAEAREIVAKEESNREDEIHFTVGPIVVDGIPTSFELDDVKELTENDISQLDRTRQKHVLNGGSMEEVEELTEEEMEILKDGVREMASWNRSFMPDDEEEDYEEIEGPIIDEEIDDSVIGRFKEEDRTLRCEPSSIDALKQYKRMELADLGYNSEVYQTMLRLFDFPFEPQNDGDHMLLTQIIDYRVQFFGFGSKWAKEVTFAEVILHYAKSAQFNCDETVEYWVNYFLEFNDLYYQYSSGVLDAAINTLNAHQYFNEERQTFGLFGLTRQYMDQAIKNASRNFDNSVTYEIEFQEFLKSVL